MSYSNFPSGIPPVHLEEGERLIIEEHRTLFGRRRITYRVVRDNGGGGIWSFLLILFLVAVAVAGYIVF